MPTCKLLRLYDLIIIRQHWTCPVVLTTGCFDVLHRGHVELLQYCAELAGDNGRVVVGINSDQSVRTLKGEARPINLFDDRAFVIGALESVDYVTEVMDTRVTRCIKELCPTIWVKGGDYSLETLDKDEVAAAHGCGATIKLFRTVGIFSTTRILKHL